jgi:cytidylate kinase
MSAGRFRVVTVSREYGSGGAAIAAKVAALAGFQLLDRALIERMAHAARVDPGTAEKLDEHVDPWVARLGRALWFGGIDAVAAVDREAVVDAERMAILAARVIEEAAVIGDCVIVGRGAQCVLRGRPDAFHVFVYASVPDRVVRLRRRLDAQADLAQVIDATDRERAAYVRRHFGESWLDPHLYDLMVNAAIGEDAAAATIRTALETAVPPPPA